ncbi:VOC family protein [Azospirillum sp. sgz301742]
MPSFHGKFVWYELMTADMKAAEDFYRGVIGWGSRDAGVPGVSYTLFTAGESPVSGVMILPEQARAAGARPGWIGYVAVDDVDAYAGKVQEAGGRVYRAPDDIPGVGRFAILADAQGAVFALFKTACSGEAPPPVAAGTPGHAGWHELYAADGPTAFDFYAKIFGWVKADAVDMGPMGTYQLFAPGGEEGGPAFGGMMTKPDAVPVPFWNYYFNVEAINAAVERVTSRGGQIINGPHQVPGGSWIVQGLDPQGAMFSLVAPKP